MESSNEWVYVLLDPQREPMVLNVYDNEEGACDGAKISLKHVLATDPDDGDEIRIIRKRLKTEFAAKKDLLIFQEAFKTDDNPVTDPIPPADDEGVMA